MSSLQRNLLKRAATRMKPPPPERVDPRELELRMVAENIAANNGWSYGYTLNRVREIVGDILPAAFAIEQLAYKRGDKPSDIHDDPTLREYNRSDRRSTAARLRGRKRPKAQRQ
jgi:hypothetical protein